MTEPRRLIRGPDCDSTPNVRTAKEIEEKIDELRAYSDYGRGMKADQLRRGHGAWIKALRWVLGTDLVEEP